MSRRRELGIGVLGYGAYLLARRQVWNAAGRDLAQRNSASVIAAERRLGVFVEQRVQSAAGRWPRFAHVLNVGYAAANVTLSIGWLYILFCRGDPAYERERRAVVAAWAGAIPIFAAFPVAPPRKVEGFIDTLLEHGIDIERPGLVRWYNPIAAMPSYHVAFSVVSGIGLASRATSTAGRVAWSTYPGVVAAIVVATGNHYVADVAAGAALGALSRRITR